MALNRPNTFTVAKQPPLHSLSVPILRSTPQGIGVYSMFGRNQFCNFCVILLTNNQQAESGENKTMEETKNKLRKKNMLHL